MAVQGLQWELQDQEAEPQEAGLPVRVQEHLVHQMHTQEIQVVALQAPEHRAVALLAQVQGLRATEHQDQERGLQGWALQVQQVARQQPEQEAECQVHLRVQEEQVCQE